MTDIPGVRVDDRLHSRVLEAPLAAPRRGIMLHYDDSSRDDWAVAWFQDPRCTNGYTWLVLDDGRVVELADPGMRTPHAGPCLTPNANSAYYGIAAATNGLVLATAPQLASITDICIALMKHHSWDAARIVGHDAQAIWTLRTRRGVSGGGSSAGRSIRPDSGRTVSRSSISERSGIA